MRVTTITAVAAVALLTACTESGKSMLPLAASCRSHPLQSPGTALQTLTVAPPKGTQIPHRATATELGLWPREGPSIRACGDVGKGFARCQAWLRTDIRGPMQPDTPGGYAPSDLQTAYGLTSDVQNSNDGPTVALVDAYDNPNAAADLNVYRAHYGLPACTSAGGCFTKQQFTSQTNVGWAGEESVDVDMVSAVCPHCKILLVEAASASIGDLSAAEQYATTHADYVSNSWGADEGTKTYDNDYKVNCGAIVAATGDGGYNATAHWPAILPNVVAVGGTSLTSVNPRTETAWLHSGSGCSKIYGKPAYQSSLNTGCSMRAEADLSADGDPRTGVAIYDTFHQDGWLVFGGTSVAAPIVASVFALAGDGSTTPLRNLYSHTASMNDVTSGSNGACGPPLCVAGAGWDGPTGVGTPQGLAAF